MEEGEASGVTGGPTADQWRFRTVISTPLAEPTLDGSAVDENGAEQGSGTQMIEKDPRKIARKYQLDLCKKALEENIVVYLGTGCGKTHIAVLLIYEMGHLLRKPQKDICVFLAPTVALVQQQARVIEKSIDFKVGVYYGNSKRLKRHEDWVKETEQYEILVMTPQMLLHNLCHCFLKIESIALLIFDECHHAQVQSSHPYAEIMKLFYKPDLGKVPRVFGMTASPVVGKGTSDRVNLPKAINSLENLLNAKVYSVENEQELDDFVASPKVRVFKYDSPSKESSSFYMVYSSKLEEIKRQCMSTLNGKTNDHQRRRSLKKLLIRMHDNILFCLENLGVLGALQASISLLSGDHSERNELIEMEGNFNDDSICDTYLDLAAKVFAPDSRKDGTAFDLSCVEILKEPDFSRKLLRLVGILSSFRFLKN